MARFRQGADTTRQVVFDSYGYAAFCAVLVAIALLLALLQPRRVLRWALIANLGYDKLVMPKPVFLGDTLRARTEVVELKDSKRPGAGIVTFRHELLNQRDEIVCQCLRTALLHRSPA